jgi:predicted ribosome quality control (RQC) complex YloA/Tae2 family protein
MSLNWKEINRILEELDLPDSHIQQIFQRDYRNIYLQVFRPGRTSILRICLEQGKTRIHETLRKPGSRGNQPRFSEFLRARIRGGRIVSARQLGGERIIEVRIQRGDEASLMYIKLWSNASNILLCDGDGVILDAAFRRPRRGEAAGEVYQPQDRDAPRELEARPGRDGMSYQESIAREYAEQERAEERGRRIRELNRYFAMRETSLAGRMKRIAKAREASGTADELQHRGDLILSNLWKIQGGDTVLEAEDYDAPGSLIRIELDASLTPSENAERCFAEARKIRSRAEHLSQEADQIERQLTETRQILGEIADDETPLERLRELVDEVRERSGSSRGSESADGLPGLEFSSGGFRILVGRNARENDALLRRHTRGNDTWLHARDYPGGYVFIKYRAGKTVPLDVLLDAGNLALFFSKARANGQADLYYTQVKYLRRAKDGKTGLVLPTQEKNMFVKADEKRLDRLLKGETG